MRFRLFFTAICITTSLTGCQSLPTMEQMKVADYGSAPDSEKSKTWAKEKIKSTLLDPYSAVIQCDNPRKGAANILFEVQYGYLLACTVNAKNSFGAYTGAKDRNFWIKHGHGSLIETGITFTPAPD